MYRIIIGVRELPSGTVTFLFTDIEGSTRLLHELGDRYADALAEHRRVLRKSFVAHRGVEVDTQGDAFFVAFARASDGATAARSAQDMLASGPIRVRMGLHTGEPILTEEGYVGLDVHKGARIAACGNGGQVLLSEATRRLIDAEVRDLGLHRLKDLQEPERIFQLGEGEFPPLKSLNQTNLPVQPTPFLGRERELAEVLDLFRREDVRLLTLTGAGGTGKTRLALQAVAELVEEYPDGVWFVGLAAVMDPGLLLPTIAQKLEVREAAGETLEHALARHLQSKRMVLLLDNMEQLLPAAAPPLGKLCAECPDLELVVTSREPLHLAAEREYPVRSLSNDEALRLFAGRAKAARPGFELRDENRSAVEAICMRLDRLPLAIELAAARVKLLPPDKLLSRLEQRLPVLVGGPHDAPERQRTLRAAIGWSHDLLRDEERVLFARLALFSGGFTLEAAEEVSEADLDTLASLIDKSLLRGEEDGSTEPRFTMLETIREYAVDRLDDQGDAPELRSRHADFFLALAEQAQIELRGPGRGSWFVRLELETGNFRSAISSSLTQGRINVALRLVAALTSFWGPRGHWGEARSWLEEVLAQSEGTRIPERARALFEAGGLSLFQGEIGTSRARLEQALELAGEVGDRRTLARASARLAWVQVMNGLDVNRAVALGEEGLSVARGLGDPWELAETLNDLGSAYGDRDHSQRSVNLLEEALQLRRSIGDVAGIADSLNNLGWEAILAENYPKAVAYLQESLELARLLTDRPHVVLALDNLALAYLFAGEPAVAEELFSESLRICREIGDRRVAEEVLIGMAGVAALQQAWDRAARLAGAAARTAVEGELVPSAVVPRIEERFLSAARGALGDELYMAKFDRGRLAPFEEAVAYALSESATD
jgi:predicted ATPase